MRAKNAPWDGYVRHRQRQIRTTIERENSGTAQLSIEVVDIFRNIEAMPAFVDEAIAIGTEAIWMQRA